MFNIHEAYALQNIIINSIIICINFYIFWRLYLKKCAFIRFKIIPSLEKLKSKYGSIYPTFIETIECPALNLSSQNKLSTCMFILDDSFVIIDINSEMILAEIPFDSILFQNCSLYANSKNDYNYFISFNFMQGNKQVECNFETLRYSHKIFDKKYSNLLTGKDLYDYICKHFKSSHEYYFA